jgi:predicted nucleotide-binding protein
LVPYRAIDETLVAIFGADTVDYRRYGGAKRLDRAGLFGDYEPPISEIREGLQRGKDDSISILEGIIIRFKEELELTSSEPQSDQESRHARLESRRVFVVHGHDHEALQTVARFVSQIGLEPVILHEQASRSRTIIEKVEAHGEVDFAIVLLTPDDEGSAKGGPPQPRAQQNVLLELGYFIGRLGRENVSALKRGDLEIPSDFGGVVYESFDVSGGWKQALGRELKAAGFPIDWNKVMA